MKASSPKFQKLLAKGTLLFNAGKFFEAHEIWEESWRKVEPSEKRWLQGLIQTAVGLHHLRNRNRHGARSLLRNAVKKLSGSKSSSCPVDLPPLLTDLQQILSRLERDSSSLPQDVPIIRVSGTTKPFPSLGAKDFRR